MKTRAILIKICLVLASGILVALIVNVLIKTDDEKRGEKGVAQNATVAHRQAADKTITVSGQEAYRKKEQMSRDTASSASLSSRKIADTSNARMIAENVSGGESGPGDAASDSALIAEKMREASRKVSPFPLSVKDVTQILPNSRSPAATFTAQPPSLPINAEQETAMPSQSAPSEVVSNYTGPVAEDVRATADANAEEARDTVASESSEGKDVFQTETGDSPAVLSGTASAPSLPANSISKALPSFTPVTNYTGPVSEDNSASSTQ